MDPKQGGDVSKNIQDFDFLKVPYRVFKWNYSYRFQQIFKISEPPNLTNKCYVDPQSQVTVDHPNHLLTDQTPKQVFKNIFFVKMKCQDLCQCNNHTLWQWHIVCNIGRVCQIDCNQIILTRSTLQQSSYKCQKILQSDQSTIMV